MKRTFAIGDIHNCYLGLKQALERANITSEDELIFLGDYLDGWLQAREVIEYLWKLNSTNKCIFLMGNHDEWVQEWISGKADIFAISHWCNFGGQETKNSFEAWFKEDPSIKNQVSFWLNTLRPYYIDSENRLFVHAGFESSKGVEVDFHRVPQILWWTRDLVKSTFLFNSKEHLKKLKLYNEIYIGHTPTSTLADFPNCDIPLNVENLWALDTGAAFTGKVTVFNIDTKEYYQSDTVQLLYPNEKGRN